MNYKKPKLSTYIDSELLEKFKSWKQEHHIRSDSSALHIILSHYLNHNIPDEIMPKYFHDKLKKLEQTNLSQSEKFTDIETELSRQSEVIDILHQQFITVIESQVKEIKGALEKKGIEEIFTDSITIPNEFIPDLPFTRKDILEGITKGDLCERVLKINLPILNFYADHLGIDRDEYIYNLTYWIKDGKRYVPNIKLRPPINLEEELYTEQGLLEELNFIDKDFYLLDILGINVQEYIYYLTRYQLNEGGMYEKSSWRREETTEKLKQIMRKLR